MQDFFQPEKLLAAGPGAKVYRGIETHTGRKVLIKALLEDHEATHPYDRGKVRLLVPMLTQLRHPQIEGLITTLPAEDEFALVYEFMPGMNVLKFAAERQASSADLRALAVQLMNALLVGEHLRMPHGDPKPSNIIIADHPAGGLFLQLQDWGLWSTREEQPPETLWFRAPELHQGGKPTSQSDLFTAAASLFCLATNSAPAQGSTQDELVAEWRAFNIKSLRHMRPDVDQAFSDWIGWLMQLQPQNRPQSVAQAINTLMLSMQTGTLHVPQRQAPVMPAGFQTGHLIAGGHPNAPKPKPVTPPQTVNKPASDVAEDTPMAKAPQAPEISPKRKAFIIALNLAALLVLGFIIFALLSNGGWLKIKDALNEKMGVDVSVTPVTKVPATPVTPITAAAPAVAGASVKGRYIRIEKKGKGDASILSLAEVQVFSGAENIAVKGKAKQSTEEWGGKAELAIDGNTDGVYDHKSVSHTKSRDKDPRWELDLGQEFPISAITIWNRTDADTIERLKDFSVKVLSAKQGVVWEKVVTEVPKPSLRLDFSR